MPKGKQYTKKSMKGKRDYSAYKKRYGKKSKTSLFQEKSQKEVERKNLDIGVTAVSLPAADGWTTPTLLNGITQGVGNQNRIGRKYTNTSIQYRFTSALNTAQAVRVLMVYDSQPNGATPAITDIVTSNNFHAPMNLNTGERFKIISDKCFVPAQDGTDITTNLGVTGKEYKKMSLDSVCSGTGNTITDLQTGAIWLLAAQGSSAAGSVAAAGNIYTRLRFTDA